MTTPNLDRFPRAQELAAILEMLHGELIRRCRPSATPNQLAERSGPETPLDSGYSQSRYSARPASRGGSSHAQRSSISGQPSYPHAVSTPSLPLSMGPDPDSNAQWSMARSNSIPSRNRTSKRSGRRPEQQSQTTEPVSGAREHFRAPKPQGAELSMAPRRNPRQSSGPLTVFDNKVLGRGSQGTVVLEGTFHGRAVAVKRVLRDYYTVAAREVETLQQSNHPNVIRYYYQESRGNFLYIALELCRATLADIVERRSDFSDVASTFNAKRALRQITCGLHHLHGLQIIHRDIKPHNVLISYTMEGTGHRMLLSDFGLCKKLGADETSYEPSEAASGTIGWRAREVLRGDVRISEGIEAAPQGTMPTERLRKSVDIFPLGCLFYYVLTGGMHPFGERLRRDGNILDDTKSLEGLDQLGKDGVLAKDLINSMLSPEARGRPDTTTCLLHPYFKSSRRRVTFPG